MRLLSLCQAMGAHSRGWRIIVMHVRVSGGFNMCPPILCSLLTSNDLHRLKLCSCESKRAVVLFRLLETTRRLHLASAALEQFGLAPAQALALAQAPIIWHVGQHELARRAS